MRARRVGYFLYAPRVGGAERYVKDLLHGVDRDRFEPVFLSGSWDALYRYLSLDGIEHVAVAIQELGARFNPPGTAVRSGEPEATGAGSEIPATVLRRLVTGAPVGLSGLTSGVRTLSRLPLFRRNVRIVGDALRRAGLDALHVVNGGYPGAISALAACVAANRAGSTPVILSVCSTAFPRQVPTSIERHLDAEVLASVRAVIVPGAVPANALAEHRGFPPEKLVTIPWGVPENRSVRGPEIRAALGVPMTSLLVGTLANFTGAKGHGALLDVFHDLAARRPDVHLVLAGEGPRRPELMQRAELLGLRDRVTFPGRVDDPIGLCAALDVFVLASDIEGLPYVVLEAMSQGRPVIATDVGAMSEAVVDGVTGVLIPPRHPGALAAALERVIGDEAVQRSMGYQGRVHFEQRFSVERMLGAHQALYERVLATR